MKGADRRRRDSGSEEAGRPHDAMLLRERLTVAGRLSARLAPGLEPDRILALAVAELHHSFDYRAAYIMQCAGDELRVRAVGGTLTETHDVPMWTQPLSRGISGRVVRTGATALVHDTTLDPDHLDAAYVLPGAGITLRAQLAVPLKVAGRVWGVLSIQDTERQAFGPDDVLLVETVGAQVAAALHRAELFADLDSAFAATLGVLCDALEAGDEERATYAHGVAELAAAVAGELGLEREQAREVRYGALLRDIERIPVGAELLERTPFFATIHPIVRASRERWDGTGGPDGLAGDAIPIGARIVAACGAFCALPPDEAGAALERGAGTQFDPRVVRAVLALGARV
jgi:GAF domain-containing protein